ncbi:hypothetical protein [Actinomadura opuntiae]|uniref:hypothetical protein n=1 Tax=Actinomadura sp. OS1-43 TaxID=604315 RepID=UPI00255B0614|nr:hypothetical protein [Actinomadura sp. OS1-43]MDL4821800.1 hypothetical protein [Actinomadura sp. OS1-43]
MATFLTTHQAPGLSAEEIVGYAPTVAESVHGQFRHLFVNMFTGAIVTVYDAEDAAALEREFERIGFLYDDITEIHYVLDGEGLSRLAAGDRR